VGEVATPATIRLVFAGTSSFAVPILQTLFDEGYPISGVVTQPDRPAGRGHTFQPPPVKVKALDLRLPVHQPASLKNEEAKSLFQALAPELLVVVAYGKLLPGWLLELPHHGAVNLHGSLLPRYRGAAPIQWAMANGDAETGVCTMQLDQGLDTGPVYACEKTPIDPDESVQDLSARLAALGCGLIKRTLAGIVAGTLHPVPQDHSRATLAPILKKEDGILDWKLPARTIHNRIRAFNPWPGPRTMFRETVCRILRSRLKENANAAGQPGTILVGGGTDRFVAVVCGDGKLLELLEVQFPNRRPQAGMDFVNGFRVTAGEKFSEAGWQFFTG
jgi:methionyl-tRNA formyltransferase